MHYASVSRLWTKDIDLYSGPKVSWQFQFTHVNFNLLTAISIYSWQFQFTHSNFILLTAISMYSRQFQFFHGKAHSIFRFAHHLSTTATDSGHQKSKRKIKSWYLKSIFNVKSENQKSIVHLRTRGYLHETGTTSDRFEFVSVSIHFFSCIINMHGAGLKNELRPV